MAFRIAARTVLELGAELISSDAVAIYELVKNAIDAKSKSGVTIEFCVVLKHNAYVDGLAKIARPDAAAEFTQIRAAILSEVLADSPDKERSAFQAALTATSNTDELRAALTQAYASYNWIEFRDEGLGMSAKDLLDAYLVIGTPSRRRTVIDRVKAGENAEYLGEKGVGRLSAMRLGATLTVETAAEGDTHFSVLSIDWRHFEDLDKMVEDIEIIPTEGAQKPAADWSGTRIRIGALLGTWSAARIGDIATYELARLSDPFSAGLRRYRMEVVFNGERIVIPRLDKEILELAHARAKGHYAIVDGLPHLHIELSCKDLGKQNPPDSRTYDYDKIDIRSLTKDFSSEIAASALTSVGPFEFEFHWFNRQYLRKQLSSSEGARAAKLQKDWSGIMLFRDRYRVFPYGDDTDDWLGLDRRALASGGYKLNKSQFIGRVSISRSHNPELVDQTSREGLKDCDEKTVLVETLRFVIQDRLRKFLDDVTKANAPTAMDFEAVEKRVTDLTTRTQRALKGLETRHAEEAPTVRDLLDYFNEMQAYFASARKRAAEVEDERERVLQLAGVGLMLEMVAHELARSTEATLGLLSDAPTEDLSAEVSGLFSTLKAEMKTMNRRLRVLDPLSVSGRQRKETFDMVKLVSDILVGHKAQFQRHGITVELLTPDNPAVMITAVRGMLVQILENLVQNSVYWMDLRREDEEGYRPEIKIAINNDGHLLDYTDNGPGIQPELSDEIFTAFYSTKGKSKRQGLGLYIAQDCAKNNGMELYLSPDRRIHKNRLNTFVLSVRGT